MSPISEEKLKETTIGKRMQHNAQITLCEYDTKWPEMYRQEAIKIRKVLEEKVLQLEHVGSTSVPGLISKPIIDILLVVANSADEQSYVPFLEKVGYVLRIREPDWHEHRLLKGPGRQINLHVFSQDSSEIKRMLTFRDHLRSDKQDRELYAKTKRELAKRTWKFVQNYADAKTHVVEEILQHAQFH